MAKLRHERECELPAFARVFDLETCAAAGLHIVQLDNGFALVPDNAMSPEVYDKFRVALEAAGLDREGDREDVWSALEAALMMAAIRRAVRNPRREG